MSNWRAHVPIALRPKRKQWFLVFAGVAAGSVAIFAVLDWQWGWSPGATPGLTFGVLATVLMGLEVLYALRRRLLIRPLHTGQAWLQVHVYGGTLVALFVLIHTGFRWPNGTFGLILLGLTVLSTVSGFVGVMVQKTVPLTLTRDAGGEAILEQIPDMVSALRRQAEDTIKGASDMLQRFYESHVQPALVGPSVSLTYLVNVRSGRERQHSDFEGIRSFLGVEDRERIERLQSLLTRKMELEAHYTWQTVLRGWLIVHVPVTMLLVAAVVAHVIAVWRF